MKKLYILLFGLILAGYVLPAAAEPVEKSESLTIEVYKSPYCGCCDKWVSHLEHNGFTVISHNQDNMEKIKATFGIPGSLQSCHTGVINGYFIEGHVPAHDIKKLLSEKPEIKGLTVPGMPAGINVPGMETKAEKASFDVLAVGEAGVKVYNRYE